jgi:hypothetical protein
MLSASRALSIASANSGRCVSSSVTLHGRVACLSVVRASPGSVPCESLLYLGSVCWSSHSLVTDRAP